MKNDMHYSLYPREANSPGGPPRLWNERHLDADLPDDRAKRFDEARKHVIAEHGEALKKLGE